MWRFKSLFGLTFFLFFIGFNLAQEYKKLTSEEIALIETNPYDMMRVLRTDNYSDSLVLNSVSLPIDPTDDLTELLAERMLLSVNDPAHQGVGIAAPQVGINRKMIWVQRFDKEEKPFELFINPEILWVSDLLQKGPEGDLSFDERGMVIRYYITQVRYQNLQGETITEILEGFTSVIFQHEYDHLYGLLLTDRINDQQSRQYQNAAEHSDLYFLAD